MRELAEAVSFGVVKVNVDTDKQYAFTRALAGHVLDHWHGVLKVDDWIGDKRSFDPAGVARRRGGDGRARQASLRAARIRRTQPRGLGVGHFRAARSLIDLD